MTGKIIKDENALAHKVEELKKQGKRIVFTNGGFNLLHVGHIRSLLDAKKQGDILIVAVNSDASLMKLKGESYPIIPENERLEVLAALECIDILTLFPEITVERILLQLKELHQH